MGIVFENLSEEAKRRLVAHEVAVQSKHSLRRSPRISVRFRVQPSGIDVMSSLTAVDLSMTGMFVAGKARFALGKILRLRCRLPFQKEEVTLPGRVIWSGQKPLIGEEENVAGFGFQFTDVPPAARTKLATYYSRYIETQA